MNTLFYGPKRIDEPSGLIATSAFVVGGALVLWLSYIHFHLWQSVGYRHIPTIGPLFVAQSIAGVVLGLLAIVVRRTWAAIAGAGFALATLIGFVVTVEHGLFGFKDTWSAPFAGISFTIEVITVVVFTVAGTLCRRRPGARRAPGIP